MTLSDAAPEAVLGFGCSGLVGGNTTAESMMLLDTAFDAGIRHFDVARLYGTGDAERLLGRFARDRRDELVIATKFGLRPLPPSWSVNVGKRILRPVLRKSKPLLSMVRRHSGAVATAPRFDPEEAASSLITSLEALSTEYVDVFLLHDCTAADWAGADLRDALAQRLSIGQIRAYGTATSFAHTAEILRAGGPRPAVLQFNSDACANDLERVGCEDHSRRIVYGCLRRLLPLLQQHVVTQAGTADAWSAELDVDARSLDELAMLAVCHEAYRNPGGVVLFSSNRPTRIAGYAQALRTRRFSPDQCHAFATRVRGLHAGPR